MIEENTTYTAADFELIIELLRNVNANIGIYEYAVINNEYSYSVKVSNGVLIIPNEILRDRKLLRENDEAIKIIGESFIQDKSEVITSDIYQSILLVVIIIVILVYLIFYNNSNYENGNKYLIEKRYDLALIEFNKIDSNSVEYDKSISKINYINGLISFNNGKYEEALSYFKLVDKNDELSGDVSLFIENLEKNPVILYNAGLMLMKEKRYASALKEFQKIQNDNPMFSKAQNKMNYIRAIEYINEENYENAEEYLKGYEASDEFYDEVKSLQEKIKDHKDKESNTEYAKHLIDLANYIQDEWEISYSKGFADLKNTYLSRFIGIRSNVNGSVNNAKTKDDNLKLFKELIVKWVNNYIKRIENMLSYGRQTNYNNYLIEFYFGKEIQKNIELGDQLHSLVLKEIKKIKSQYDIY